MSAPARREADGSSVTVHGVAVGLDRAAQSRLRAEAADLEAALAETDNPFLAPLLDHCRTPDGNPVLITAEYGTPVTAELGAGPLALDAARRAAAAAANALNQLHRNNILHRGVSPDALLRYPGGRILLSCPLLPVLGELAASTTDGTGHEPPEVLEGGDWTPTGEVYALASTIWTLLTGGPPTAGSREERLARLLGGSPPVLRRPDVPAPLVDALRAGLAREPGHRPNSPVVLVGRMMADVEAAQQADTVLPAAQELGLQVPLGSRYVREQRLGSGSSGVVWRVRRTDDGALFAAKVLHQHLVEDQDAVVRIGRESTLLRRLRHENLVRIHDIVLDQGEWALVMDLVDEPNLFELIERKQVGRAEGLRLLSEVAAALAVVHGAGVVHRDLKPANILVSTVDGQRHALLTDFGVAKMLGDTTVTQHGELLGTYAYLAPEAVDASGARPASDIYALGVTAYEILAGYRPFRAGNRNGLIQQQLSEEPARPRDLPDEVWRFMSACLHKEPSQRPLATVAAQELAELSRVVARAMPAQPSEEAPREDTGAALADEIASWRTDALSPPRPDYPMTGPPTETSTHPPQLKPVAEQRKTRRRWPLFAALGGVAVLGAATGVLLNLPTGTQSPSTPSSAPTAPPPARYLVPVTAARTDDGTVALSWPGEYDQLGGLQFYLVQRDDSALLAQQPKGLNGYTDITEDEHCYRVIAVGVTEKPPDSPPPDACVDATTSSPPSSR